MVLWCFCIDISIASCVGPVPDGSGNMTEVPMHSCRVDIGCIGGATQQTLVRCFTDAKTTEILPVCLEDDAGGDYDGRDCGNESVWGLCTDHAVFQSVTSHLSLAQDTLQLTTQTMDRIMWSECGSTPISSGDETSAGESVSMDMKSCLYSDGFMCVSRAL